MHAPAVPPPAVAVVVPTWDGAHLLPACLAGLRAQEPVGGRRVHVVVVDNGSRDGTAELLAADHPEVHVVALPENLGFAGGVNAGIARARELGVGVVALLNNDAVPDPGWLAALVADLDEHPEAGAVAGKALQPGRRLLDTAGDVYTAWGVAYPRGRDQPDRGQHDAPHLREVAAATGGCSAWRVAALDDVALPAPLAGTGPLCDDFVAYWEDVDLSLRLRLRGWTVRYRPDAVVVHAQGSTSARIPGFVKRCTARNRVLVPLRCLPGPLLARCAPRMVGAWAWQLASDASRGALRPTLAGLGEAVRRLPRTLAERRAVQATASVPARDLARWVDPAWPATMVRPRDRLRSLPAYLAARRHR